LLMIGHYWIFAYFFELAKRNSGQLVSASEKCPIGISIPLNKQAVIYIFLFMFCIKNTFAF
jgi:hypothetical protein